MNARGFSLIEMMVVIALLAALVALGVPRYQRALAQAKMFDAVTALATVGGQIQASCAAYRSFPDADDIAKMAPAPEGYNALGQPAGTCDGWVLTAASIGGALPKICVRSVANKLQFAADKGSDYGVDAVPAVIRGASCGG